MQAFCHWENVTAVKRSVVGTGMEVWLQRA